MSGRVGGQRAEAVQFVARRALLFVEQVAVFGELVEVALRVGQCAPQARALGVQRLSAQWWRGERRRGERWSSSQSE